MFVALVVSAYGCSQEKQGDNAAKNTEKRSTATETTSAGATPPRTTTSIAFESDRDGNSEIYVMDSDGTDQTRLTDNPAYDGQIEPSPDGDKVAFASNRDGSNDVYMMDPNGANQTRLTNAVVQDLEPVEPSFSPSGHRLAFASTRDSSLDYDDLEIYAMNSEGTNHTRLTNNQATDSSPVFSPNGKKIAFVSDRDGNNELYVMNSDGTNQTRLTNSPKAQEFWPSFSPNGDKIAFTSLTGPDQSPTFDINVMNTDGTAQTSLTDSPAVDDIDPAFAPDGDRIAFASNRDGDFEVYVMDPDGTNLTRLTNNLVDDYQPVFSTKPRAATVAASRAPVPKNSNPIRLTDNLCYYSALERDVYLSPDGSKVAFQGCGGDSSIDLFVANSDGTGVANITNRPKMVEGHGRLAFSPDSDKMIFGVINTDDGTDDLYVINTDGTGLTNLTNNPATSELVIGNWPSYSPTGDKVAFEQSSAGPFVSDVYVMDTDGTNKTNLTNTPDVLEYDTVLSPDGDKIAFKIIGSGNEYPNYQIYVANSDGTNQIKLTANLDGSSDSPVFSPDGQMVVFVHHTGPETSDLYAINTNGSGLTRLTNPRAFANQPTSIPGTDRVAFLSSRDGDDDIYAVNLDGTALTHLTDSDWANESNPSFSADGTKMAYASARRDRAGYLVNEIYVMELDRTRSMKGE